MSTEGNPFERPNPADPSTEVPITRSGWTRLVEIAVVASIILVLLALLLPGTRRSGAGASRRTHCKNNLKQIGLALHYYHDVHGGFPPAVIADAEGNPLHSWRTLILPFLEQQKLYDSIDLSKAWNDPVNLAAFENCPHVYRCPSADTPDNHTSYVAMAGEHGFLHPRLSRKISEITDGTSNTVAIVEVPKNQSVHWMAPTDSGVDLLLYTVEETETSHKGGFQGLMADGAARFFSSQMPMETRQALATVAGGETIGEF